MNPPINSSDVDIDNAGKGSRSSSNLVRIRRSQLGKSAPTLSVHVVSDQNNNM
ncbi:unnamed protein product [Diatraea saccharalis]|uniref:Uncharacterized protein n=1 Tax=Diatraea saccharalis TaxID=40085 RepID=A0A9N9REG8_9NEOP|nr:unnamed protein product [Diatraea saccharalis]